MPIIVSPAPSAHSQTQELFGDALLEYPRIPAFRLIDQTCRLEI
jgi:hypothetical protein